MPKCGNDECSCSTGIHGGLTFGYGELDEYGFWEIPCRICAENWDNKLQHRIAEMNLTEKGDYEWVRLPGHPYK